MASGRHYRGDAATAYKSIVLQHEAEAAAFIELFVTHSVMSYLEIGAKFGGLLWRVGLALPRKARVVAVDLPGGTDEWDKTQVSLAACIARLREFRCDAHVLWGDSTDEAVISAVRKLGPFDLVFIDGDHRLPGIAKDWENYGTLGKVVAFHDIAWKNEPKDRGYQIDAPILWDSLKDKYEHIEIKLDPTGRDNGIGVLFLDREKSECL